MKEKLFSLDKKDFIIQTFTSGGSGGQHQNKTESGVRLIHKESGAVAESRSYKSQFQNKKAALQRLVLSQKFKIWMNRKTWEIINKKTTEQIVDNLMKSENLKIEGKNEKGWCII